MKLNRRDFLKLSGATIGGILLAGSDLDILYAHETYYLDKKIVPDHWKKGICRYCGTGCGTEVGIKDGKVVAIRGNRDYPVNKGVLCLKGLSLMYVIYTKERAFSPYIKKNNAFEKISYENATDLVAKKIRETVRDHGPDSVALYAGAQLFTEEMYLGNKLFKGMIGTNNVESNARLCMASAVTGFLTTFGADEPAGGYDDIEKSDCFFIIGSNLAEQHPIIFARVLKRKAEDPENIKIIVADPRFTPTASLADLWLPFYPGTDLALLNSMANILVNEGYEDPDFIDKHTNFVEGGGPWGKEKKLSFEEFKRFLDDYSPESVAELTGVEKEKIIEAARLFGKAKNCVSFWTMGLNQRRWGTWANNLVYNLHLLTGKICRPGSTPLSMTGQCNACGGVREQGMLSHILPAHRSVKNKEHREEMEDIWDIPHGSISDTPGLHTLDMFGQLGDKIKLIWIVCSNPAQTLPNLNKFLPKLKDAYVIVQDIFPPTDIQSDKFRNVTGEFADLFIPSAFWIEKQGVYGNTERRSALTENAIEPPDGLRTDAQIFIDVAKKLGYNRQFQYDDIEDVWDEYRKATKGTDLDLSGATYSYLREKGSAQWPILESVEGGTQNRYTYPNDKYLKKLVDEKKVILPDDNIYFYGQKDGRAKIFKRPHKNPGEIPDSSYPFYLTTGRVVHHWHSGTMTMRVPWLKKMVKESFVEINIKDAKKLGIQNNDTARLISKRGEITLKAKVVDTEDGRLKGVEERVSIPRPGVVFVPFFDADKLINLLTIDAHDDMSKQPEYKICAVRIEKE